MRLFISNLIPRLRQFSENLDRKEFFLDIPWVIVDENLNQQKYIFKRNGELVMSLNGQVTIGKWEYFSTAKSLLIDRIQDKILLNQSFISPAVMILKKDGLIEDNVILVNQILLPDLNIDDYLKRLYYQKNNIIFKQLNTVELLELEQYEGPIIGKEVTIEGDPIPDGFVQLAGSQNKYLIKDSKIAKVLVDRSYNSDKGEIVIETEEYLNPSKGDFVFQNGNVAPDGKYKLGFMWYIVIENGKIVK
jgi:hypothetical protein